LTSLKISADPFITHHNPVDSAPFQTNWCHLQISTASYVGATIFIVNKYQEQNLSEDRSLWDIT